MKSFKQYIIEQHNSSGTFGWLLKEDSQENYIEKIRDYLVSKCGWFNDYDESATGTKTKHSGVIYIDLKTKGVAKFVVKGYTSPNVFKYGNGPVNDVAEDINQFVEETF